MPNSINKGFGPATRKVSSRLSKRHPTTYMFKMFQVRFPIVIRTSPKPRQWESDLNSRLLVKYRWNLLDELFITAVPNTLLTEFCIYHRSEGTVFIFHNNFINCSVIAETVILSFQKAAALFLFDKSLVSSFQKRLMLSPLLQGV